MLYSCIYNITDHAQVGWWYIKGYWVKELAQHWLSCYFEYVTFFNIYDSYSSLNLFSVDQIIWKGDVNLHWNVSHLGLCFIKTLQYWWLLRNTSCPGNFPEGLSGMLSSIVEAWRKSLSPLTISQTIFLWSRQLNHDNQIPWDQGKSYAHDRFCSLIGLFLWVL